MHGGPPRGVFHVYRGGGFPHGRSLRRSRCLPDLAVGWFRGRWRSPHLRGVGLALRGERRDFRFTGGLSTAHRDFDAGHARSPPAVLGVVSLRVIGGVLSGRRFDNPKGKETRPTSDRVREGIFSALGARIDWPETPVLDLFAGSGALSIEALSRGAPRACAVDRDPNAIRVIRHNATTLGLEGRLTVQRIDLLKAALPFRPGPPEAYRLVFMDPPYDQWALASKVIGPLLGRDLVSPDALWVLEVPSRAIPENFLPLATIASYRYGDTTVLLAQHGEHPSP
ncbi:MAG: RsmD family RNA methyltransferase [Myxococcales bacterium]|nr:RsmD family RNA methyltransferase [Myxococcales bacterium]